MARILLIDDNPTLRYLLRMQLEAAGHQVLEAQEGSEALQLLEKAPANLVMCDLFMPGKEGLETIRELRRTSQVPIIAMTGDGPPCGMTMLELARKFGADRALVKPFDGATLLETVREALADKSSES